MNLTATIVIEGSDARLEGKFPKTPIIDATSYYKQGYKFMPRYKQGVWDGRIRLFNSFRNTFPAGLTHLVKGVLKDSGIRVSIDDRRSCPPLAPIIKDITLNGVTFDYPYDFQLDAMEKMILGQRGIAAIATNGGKTEISILITACLRLPTLFVVPGKELLYQTQNRYAKRLSLDISKIGLIGDGHWKPGQWITIAVLDSLFQNLKTDKGRELLGSIDLIFIDECFPAGTMVGDKPIEKIKVGDLVPSFDEETGQIVHKKVTWLYINHPYSMVQVVLGGKSLFCTFGHPFLTHRGWIEAWQLQKTDMVLCSTLEQESRRGESLPIGETGTRSEERQITYWTRVDSVEVLKQTSDGTFGGVCPNGLVYNLKVKDTHTYFANNAVVHNCHHQGSNSWYQVVRACPAYFRYGLSGTPLKRTDGADLRLLAATGPVLYEVRNKFLIERQISSEVEIQMLKMFYPKNIPERTPYPEVYKAGIVDNLHRNRALCLMAGEFAAKGLKILMMIKEIRHGDVIDKRLWSYKAGSFTTHQFIHGKESTEVRQKALADFEQGLNQVLIATSILDEGVDIPSIDVLILCGGGKSSIKSMQRLGRGIRFGGTGKLIVVDVADFQHRYLLDHSLQRLSDYRNEDCFTIRQIKLSS